MSDPTTTPEGNDRPGDAPRPAVAATRSGADYSSTESASTEPSTADSRSTGPSSADRAASSSGSSAEAAETVVVSEVEDTAIAPPTTEQPVAAPVATPAVPPKKSGNRLVGTAWVLLASGVFEALYVGAIALVHLLLAGPQAVGPQLAFYAASSVILWFPVLVFFLLFELSVLVLNRAGRFVYVVASLLVGIIVYAAVIAITVGIPALIASPQLLLSALTAFQFVLAGLLAREVMLWTGFAIGSRGTRVRRRNRRAKQRYQAEVADAGA